jgi:DNA end-binding protein Ku
MPSSVWSGYVTFGLISIPVKLFSAARSESISFRMLHKECGTRVKQQYICPVHERPVTREEIVKGYEFEKDRYIEVSPEEIKKIEPRTARAMEILEFVPLAEVDAMFFDTSYYLVPEDPGLRAYVLLRQAMADSGKCAIARLSMHNREYTAILRPLAQGLALHSMFFRHEVGRIEELGPVNGLEVKEKELELAHSLIQSLSGPFEPEKYSDSFQANLRTMLDAKLQGQPVTEVEKPKLAPVIDLMAALKKSLEDARKLPRKQAAADAAAEPAVRPAQRVTELAPAARPRRKSARSRSG